MLYLTCPTTISSANPKVNRRVFAREWPTCDTFCSWGTCIKPGLGKHNSPWFFCACACQPTLKIAKGQCKLGQRGSSNCWIRTFQYNTSNGALTCSTQRFFLPNLSTNNHTLPGVNFRSSQGLRYVDNCRHIPRFQPNSAAQLSKHHADPCRCFAEVPPRRCSFWDKESADSSGSLLNLGGGLPRGFCDVTSGAGPPK